MAKKEQQLAKQETAKEYFSSDNVKAKFQEMLGKRAPAFIASILQCVNDSDRLREAPNQSVYMAASTAAQFNLPINPNLGFAYIIPYNVRQSDGSYKVVAQFQMGYKGYIQLAQRSGLYKTIAMAPVYEGQLVEVNPLTGNVYDWALRSGNTILGYVAYFKLVNGFEKSLFMSYDALEKHAKKYSQTYKKGFGMWKDDFDSMASKTVLKLLLAKFGPLSIEMEHAILADQAEVVDSGFEYVDNKQLPADKELERFRILVDNCATPDDVNKLVGDIPPNKFTDAMKELANNRVNLLLDQEAANQEGGQE